ncbi:hypothetical protein [uncultured Tateyamaria sp.]|uniref:hypothetical protein n=1 Tax=uncultured Tateyamaria sp. TaxID=455651 RepID=UPI00262DA5D8|nr:hypothetical protein [uncultured Tateyamaria sp.]
MAKRGRKTELRQLRTYLNSESETEAQISEFIEKSVRMRASHTMRLMLAIAWEQMQGFDRAEFERHFQGCHNFSAFDRMRSKQQASDGSDSLTINPPTPKIK